MLGYFYKEILYFFLINKSIFQSLNFYFVCTNVLELFLVYLQIIKFFSTQLTTWYFCYNYFMFFSPAFYKKEFFFIKNLINLITLCWVLNFLLIIFIIFPVTFQFFENFESLLIQNSLHFEIKIFEYFNFFIKTYYFIQYYSLSFLFLIILTENLLFFINYTKKFRKLIFFLLLLFTILNTFELIYQLLFYFFVCFFYELQIFLKIFKKNIKIR